jgi:hypothetical protein
MTARKTPYAPFAIPCVTDAEDAEKLRREPRAEGIRVWHKSSEIFEWAAQVEGKDIVALDFRKSTTMYIPLTMEQFAAFMKRHGFGMPSMEEALEEARNAGLGPRRLPRSVLKPAL